jgi:hypothetical protein
MDGGPATIIAIEPVTWIVNGEKSMQAQPMIV